MDWPSSQSVPHLSLITAGIGSGFPHNPEQDYIKTIDGVFLTTPVDIYCNSVKSLKKFTF